MLTIVTVGALLTSTVTIMVTVEGHETRKARPRIDEEKRQDG